MEELFNRLKELILNQFNDNLKTFYSENLTIKDIKEKAIVFGSVDVAKFTDETIISIYPDDEEESDDTIDGDAINNLHITVGIITKNDKYENLIKKICRLTECFKQTLVENYDLNGFSKNINFGSIKYYPDAGNTEKTVVATETELTIYVESNYFN